jgi:hypothetical protein
MMDVPVKVSVGLQAKGNVGNPITIVHRVVISQGPL